MAERRFVLVDGVVYQLVEGVHRRQVRDRWMRISVPPDAVPGRGSAWPAWYEDGQLPAHQVIDEERAKAIQAASIERVRHLDPRTGAPVGYLKGHGPVLGCIQAGHPVADAVNDSGDPFAFCEVCDKPDPAWYWREDIARQDGETSC